MAVFSFLQFQTRHRAQNIKIIVSTKFSNFSTYSDYSSVMAGPSGVKTRHSSGIKMAEYLGTGKTLLCSELPTLRSVLRQGLLYKEEKILQEGTMKQGRSYTYGVGDVASDMTTILIAQWKRANADFKSPVVVSDEAIKLKLKLAWETAQQISVKKITKAVQIKAFEDKLDRLVDITKCHCDIILCENFNCIEQCRKCKTCKRCGTCKDCKDCVECNQGAHIICSCPRECKLPLLELRFLLAQRQKREEKADIMISGSIDQKEQAQQEKKLARENLTRMREEKKKVRYEHEQKDMAEMIEQEKKETSDMVKLLPENESQEDNSTLVEPIKKRNTVDIAGLASTAIRFQISDRAAAACASAFLGDLIRADILPPEAASMAVDAAKIHRAKVKMSKLARERGEGKVEADTPKCILFDSRIDRKTLVMHYDEETKKCYPRVEAEDHYTITDGDGNYLHHLTKPGKNNEEEHELLMEESVDEENMSDVQKELQKLPAEVVANLIWNWMLSVGVDRTLSHIGADSTNSNTGWKKGIIALLEKIMGRKFHWLICMLHTNELGLRKLVETLDGKTSSKTGFSGPLGKLLSKVGEMKPNFSFKKIDIGPDVIELPEEVVSTLSRDQKIIYKRWEAVKTGELSRDVALCKSGPIVHSRWLTTAETFLKMYQSNHGLEGELVERLKIIVTYIASVYCPMWFLIKKKHSWIDGPRHILEELSLFHLQSPDIQAILLPTLLRSVWHSHSESVLQTMLCSEEREERGFAISMILKIRGKKKKGNMEPRPRKLPKLNVTATKLKDMIDWKGAKEPVLTCHLSNMEIKEYKEKPMQVPYYPIHTQGIERAVKEVTMASETVYGFERRDGFIRARAENRSIMPSLKSKKSLENLLK